MWFSRSEISQSLVIGQVAWPLISVDHCVFIRSLLWWRTLETKFPLQPLLRTYGNWLACIAGSMASVAFIAAWAEQGPESQTKRWIKVNEYIIPIEPGQAGWWKFRKEWEGYKEKGEPIGTTPDRLAVTAIDCVSSWNSFCLTFLFSRLSTFCLMMHDDATFSWCRLPLQPFLLPAVCLDVFSPWHFFLSTSFSDGATFSPSGLRWSSPLNHDSPYCWQLWSPRPDTLFSPDKLLSPHSWLSYLFISPLSSFPYSFHVPSLSVLYSFQPSLHFPILCTFSRHPYLWASLFLETFFSSLLSTSHSLDAGFAWHHFSSFLLLHCFILLFWDLFLLKLFHLTPSVLTSPLSWSHLSRLFLLTFSYLANKN